MRPMRMKRLPMLAIAVAMGLQTAVLVERARAQAQLVTVPRRDAVELTLYKGYDFALVKEQRNVTLRQGVNLIPFSWVGTLIDPASVRLRPVGNGRGIRALETIISPRLQNTLQFQVESDSAGAQKMEVSYFIGELRWQSDYLAFVNPQETQLRLQGFFTVSNASGEDFEDASVRLVVGEIHLIQPVFAEAKKADAEKAMKQSARAAQTMDSKSKEELGGAVVRPLSEYYVYTLDGKHTLADTWSKKTLAFDAQSVPVRVVYQYAEGAVRRLYMFTNHTENGLGAQPLPSGMAHVFMVDKEGRASLVGVNGMDFTPVGKEVKLDLGNEYSVEVERELMDFKRLNVGFNDEGNLSNADIEEEYRFEARNYRLEAITLEVLERWPGQWQLTSSSQPYERKDANTVLFTLQLGSGETKILTYRMRRAETSDAP